ncbi:MAG: redox-regulated ATPase YchF, partial [Nanoarchaeota archaeon]|nr:redox-regulated ATPase YchF [Nanoarchaeota archaeon]
MLIGLFGGPSKGKSTFFKAATLAEVAIAAYPFTTLTSSEAVAYVKLDCVEKEFNVKCNPRFGYCLNGKRFVPVRLMDVPGLIQGSHEGLGRGNAFLDDLRQADLLIHIIDISGSTNENGEAVDPLTYDPLNDVILLEKEIDLWFFSILNKEWSKFIKLVHAEKQEIDKAIAKQFSGLKVNEDIVNEAMKKLNMKKEECFSWNEKDLKNLCIELRKLSKPIIIAANKIDILGAKKNFERLKERFPNYLIIPCSAESELALKEAAKHKLINYIPGENSFEIIGDLKDEQKNALDFIQKNVLDKYGSTGVQEILDRAVFDLLKYIAIFPGGVNKLQDSEGRVLPDCFLLPEESTALDFAYKIHTTIGDTFIKAIDVKKKMIIGKDHKLKNRDVIEIVC